METLSLSRHIEAPPESVWSVLADFGAIDRWSPGVKRSRMLTDGPIGVGSTRHCDFTPLGSAKERIEEYVSNRRMRVVLFDIAFMPLGGAEAVFVLAPTQAGTDVTFEYSFERKRAARLLGGMLPAKLRSGLGQVLDGLKDAVEAAEDHDRTV